jgi:hypothetical protein
MSTTDFDTQYRNIVSEATLQATRTMETNAARGHLVPLVLHYKREALGLFPEGAATPDWNASEHVLGIGVPYSGFWGWIYNRARRLPIYGN